MGVRGASRDDRALSGGDARRNRLVRRRKRRRNARRRDEKAERLGALRRLRQPLGVVRRPIRRLSDRRKRARTPGDRPDRRDAGGMPGKYSRRPRRVLGQRSARVSNGVSRVLRRRPQRALRRVSICFCSANRETGSVIKQKKRRSFQARRRETSVLTD